MEWTMCVVAIVKVKGQIAALCFLCTLLNVRKIAPLCVRGAIARVTHLKKIYMRMMKSNQHRSHSSQFPPELLRIRLHSRPILYNLMLSDIHYTKKLFSGMVLLIQFDLQ